MPVSSSNTRNNTSPPSPKSAPFADKAKRLKPNMPFGAKSQRPLASSGNDNVDLRVEKASIHGIVGENGAGKSTLMNILYGFLTADTGTLNINGTSFHFASIAGNSVAFAIPSISCWWIITVMENIILGAEGEVLLDGACEKRKKNCTRLTTPMG